MSSADSEALQKAGCEVVIEDVPAFDRKKVFVAHIDDVLGKGRERRPRNAQAQRR